MCTQTPIRINNIRAGRRKPGLLRQHLTCVLASQTICGAKVSGAELGSQSLTFEPGAIQSGNYSFSISTAGSTCLVFQTVLPALLLAEKESTVSFHGGTHNMMAPSFDFIQHSFIPTLRLMNIHVSAELAIHGFYPTGGGEWSTTIKPLSSATPLVLVERGETQRSAVVTQAKLTRDIAERELGRVQEKLGIGPADLHINDVVAPCAGNVLSLHFKHQHGSAEVVEALGRVGLPAERVADQAIKAGKRYLDSNAVVGEHLCDQLLLPMALGTGGRFTTLKPTLHTLTNIAVIESFLDRDIKVTELESDCFEVVVSG
ncbi:UNVERIFIED_CONTAM: hypothetical protein GTU68_032660 [Idotea baltica]|nr:hypothetical protein [Idotea baltica]